MTVLVIAIEPHHKEEAYYERVSKEVRYEIAVPVLADASSKKE
jgi:hypothetical protein